MTWYNWTMKIKHLSIEDVVSLVVDHLFQEKVIFKNETFLSQRENDVVDPSRETREDVEVNDMIHDEDENERYDCQILVPTACVTKLVVDLTSSLGAPTEMRVRRVAEKDAAGNWVGRDTGDRDPVWKFGRKGKGQLWIYPHGEKTYVDVRYYYEKA